MRANNNPKNRRGLLNYQKRQLELAKITEPDARGRRIQSNVDKWIGELPKPLSMAFPMNLHKDTVKKISTMQLQEPYSKYTIITSTDLTKASFTAYAMLFTLIQNGAVSPDQIKITNILDGYNNINGMFGARKWKDYFFDDNAKVLVIEGASKYLTVLGSRGEAQFWRELSEFTNRNDKLVIITYQTEKSEEESKQGFIPELSIDRELNHKMCFKSQFIKLKSEEEAVIQNGQDKTYRGV